MKGKLRDKIWPSIMFFYKFFVKKPSPMGVYDTVDFLQEHGCKVLRVTVFAEGCDMGSILFSLNKIKYTIAFQNKIFKRLIIKDSHNHHNLMSYSFSYMEYDDCYPMTDESNENISFSQELRFCEAIKKWFNSYNAVRISVGELDNEKESIMGTLVKRETHELCVCKAKYKEDNEKCDYYAPNRYRNCVNAVALDNGLAVCKSYRARLNLKNITRRSK
jgi:hypothetical protein